MTLKQFFQIAGGVIISLIFYSTPLHPIIKWPIMLFSTGLGAAMAFLPFEERPLEKWIIAFFRSIYSPTLYSWRKLDKPLVFYTENAVAPAITAVVNSAPTAQTDSAKLEAAEQTFLQKIGGLFNVSGTVQAPVVAPTSQPTIAYQQPTPIQVGITTVTSQAPQAIPVSIPKTVPKFVVEESGIPATQTQESVIDVEKIEEKPITSDAVEFSIDAAPPSPPIAVNTITGQVMDADRKIIEGAILEIKDSNGRPVRALKSNKAGHFIIVTPLQNGKYEITIEKDGFNFDPVSFDAVGQMIPSMAIRGTRVA